jgi:hypothetical protein
MKLKILLVFEAGNGIFIFLHMRGMNMFQKVIIIIAGFLLVQCSRKEQSVSVPEVPLPFESKPVTVAVTPGLADEASGICFSKTYPGSLWVQQDGGNPAEIILMDDKGAVKKRLLLKSAFNRDWEDMASGAGPSADSNYIYIAETGDNGLSAFSYSIYRFAEPAATTDTITKFDKINFKYPDGSHDAEAIFVSKQKDIYILTKRDSVSKIYKLPFPQSTASVTTATAMGQLTFTGVTGAACSDAGNEILVKTYSNVYYWKLNTNELPEAALQRKPIQLGYEPEPQGEAICFQYNNGGFYTLSEKPFFATSVTLNFYRRK